jgi:putative acetyltransferase
MITIRPQNTGKDLQAIAALNAAAFADHGGTEAFDKFRAERKDIVSLVAEEDGELLGHVLFSPVRLKTPNGKVAGMGLGQLAVAPERQNQGIGTLLSETGIEKLRSARCPFVIVIGHAAYYPRFGFERGSLHDVKCQWPNIPDETFMVLFLDEQSQRRLTGIASFDGL